MELPSSPLPIAGATRVHDAVLRNEGLPDHDVLAARAAHPGGEPCIENLVARARNQCPDGAVGARDRQNHPAGGIAAAGKTPAPGNTETAGHGLSLGSSRIEAARCQSIRPTGEEFLLGLLGEVTDPPVMRR